MQNKKIVVLDHNIPELMNNKIFNPVLAKKISHTILPTCYLYHQAQKQGIQFITADIFLNLKEKTKKVLLISGLITPFTKKLITLGATPAILTCQESPFIATRFYTGLKKYSSWYKHSFVFKGMKKRLSKKTIYHQMFFPQPYQLKDCQLLNFNQKEFLAMVVNAKTIDDWRKKIILKLMYGFNVREIYSERLKAIKFFAEKGNLDLFGFSWAQKNFDKLTNLAIKKVYRGAVEDKLKTLKNYKFALCFENTIFEGYVTEKIFDALFAGCVPIYFGAPDIENYVNRNCFIDFRKFKNYEQLYSFLKDIDENQYNQYIENIRRYLQSESFKKFTQENSAKKILEILIQEFENYAKN